MTAEEQRHASRFRLVWRMVVQARGLAPHAFELGCGRETLCYWVAEAAKQINRSGARTAVFAAGLTPGELRLVMLEAAKRGWVEVIKTGRDYTKFRRIR